MSDFCQPLVTLGRRQVTTNEIVGCRKPPRSQGLFGGFFAFGCQAFEGSSMRDAFRMALTMASLRRWPLNCGVSSKGISSSTKIYFPPCFPIIGEAPWNLRLIFTARVLICLSLGTRMPCLILRTREK